MNTTRIPSTRSANLQSPQAVRPRFGLTRARLLVAAIVLAVLGAVGVWTLLNPASLLVQPWRATQSRAADDIIFGPYPTEEDFKALKADGVTRIVSLLNPVVPYEKILLAQERERAERYGIELLNFPMGSILGQKFGDDYVRNSRAAAEAALTAEGTAYIHCYLGVNRAKYVQRYISSQVAGRSRNYAGVDSTLSLADVEAFGRVEAAYKAQRHEQVLEELKAMPGRNAQALRMEGWSNFKLGRIPQARAAFTRLLAEVPGDADANTGLGYAALRLNELATAERYFEGVQSGYPDDPAVLEGLGHVRYRQGRSAEAKALFERAHVANPANDETRQMIERLKAVDANAANSQGGAG